MAEGISVSLPLRVDPIDGLYGLNKNIKDLAEQNLKMVILTSPGERMMIPEFGVGIRKYLFEQNVGGTLETIKNNISAQVSKYLPYITLKELLVFSPRVQGTRTAETDNTRLSIVIKYHIPAANIVSNLTIPVTI
jgi:phage baseplate assembly protein W